jgi:predicted SAM-dependent methyltransferase
MESQRRLNWGCGNSPAPGWINSDKRARPGVELVADIMEGLPIDADSMDYIVSIHALEEVPIPALQLALVELRRILKTNGVLRLVLPDFDRGLQAYLAKESSYFLIPDSEYAKIGSKFIVQMLWYGYSRSLFTYDFLEELLYKAGFQSVQRCEYRTTSSGFPSIVELDNRPDESLFVEAIK